MKELAPLRIQSPPHATTLREYFIPWTWRTDTRLFCMANSVFTAPFSTWMSSLSPCVPAEVHPAPAH